MDTLLWLRSAVLQRAMPAFRAQRMAFFEKVMDVCAGMKVLDLGGTAYNWQWAKIPLDVTILNLPGFETKGEPGPHRMTFVEGDATMIPQYADMSFDLVFSNSVIEHVGGLSKEFAFAQEVRRLAPAYFVQTPSKYFPYEPHTGMPFWWYYPDFLRNRVLRDWEERLPAYCDMVKGTTYVTRQDLLRYFPDGMLHVERMGGIPKSYTIYRSGRGATIN